MMGKIRQWLEPPHFPGFDEKNARARTMSTIGHYFLIAVMVTAIVFVPLLASRKLASWLILLVMLVFYGISRMFLFRGKLEVASAIMIVSGWCVCVGLTILGGGIYSPLMIVAMAITIVIGLLFQKRVGTIFFFISLLGWLGIAIFQQNGIMLPRYFSYSPISTWFFIAMAMAFMNQTVRLITGELETALALAHQHSDSLRQAETVLRDSETRFRALSENSLAGIYIIQEEQLVYVNPALANILGYTPDELIGANVLTVIHPDDHALVIENIHRRMAGKFAFRHYELRGQCKNGEKKQLEVLGMRIEMAGQPAIVGNLLDITARKQAEDALRRSEARLREVLENMPILMDAFKDDGSIIVWNKECERVTGYSAAEITGNPQVLEILYPDAGYRNHLLAEISELGNNFRNKEWTLTCKDGRQRIVSWSNITSQVPIPGWEAWAVGVDVTERKQAAEMLSRYQLLFEYGRDIMLFVRKDGQIIEANAAAVQSYGYSRDELLLLSIRDLRTADSQDLISRQMEQAVATGIVFETVHCRKDGSMFPVEVSSQGAVLDGQMVLLSVIRDITARKNAEVVIRKNEAQLRTLINTIPDLVWLKDPDGVYLLCNRRFESFFGAAEENIIGKTDYDFMDKELGDFFRERDKLAIRAGRPTKNEEEVVFAVDEHREFLETIKTPVYGNDGEVLGVLGIGRNITERKRAEEALIDAKEFAENVIQTANIIFVELNALGEVVRLNQAAEQITGYSQAELVGRNWFDVLVPKERYPYVWNEFANVAEKGGVPRIFENPIITAAGEERCIVWQNSMLRQSGEIVGTISFGVDITERKLAEGAEREQRTLAEALSASAAALNSTLNFEAVLDRIMDNVGRVVPHESVEVMLLDEAHQVAQIVGHRDIREQPTHMKGTRFSVQQTRNLYEMQRTGEPVIVDDAREYDGWVVTPLDPWIRSNLGVPIKIKGEIIGFLGLDSASPHAFTRLDAERLQAFSNHAAIAIENARLYEEVQKLAVTDTLTGVFNRAFFETELARLEHSRDFPVSIVVTDLDNMKITNDTLGHAVGDMLLKNTVQVLQKVFRVADIVARIGGDEFAMLLPRTDAATTGHILSRVRSSLADYNAAHPDVPIELSLGAATAEYGGLMEAFVLADQHMYANKSERKSSRRA